MMRIIEYFLHNKRLNYVLLFFLLFLGINAYQNIPKELFPEITLDKISIAGAYSGASAENLDKMAVRDIEDELGDITGVESIETLILPGTFSITINLENGADKSDALDKAKDAIARSRQYLPSDMVEPTAQILNHNRPLISLSLSSEKLSKGELIERAKEIKSKIARLPYISEVNIYGDADQEVSIQLQKDQVRAYGLDPSAVISAVSNLSYIYPIGDIKESGNYIFLSTVHGKDGKEEWESALIKVGEHQVRLGDIANIEITYPQDQTLSTFNGRRNMTLMISKGAEGNAIELSQTLREFAENTLSKEYPKVYFDFYQDTSKPVKDRLNVVISNLLFGLILVFASMALLINVRIATVVAMGIPISFAVGLIFIYFMGYSINIVSLLGGLIVIGIVVDDAIVVGENIQRYINQGVEKREAVLRGVKEMLLPVSLATLTTIAAFLPLFMMTGEIKNFIILIPIAVIMILIGSLIESFLFLPLHSEEILIKQKNMIDWTKFQDMYESLLHKVIHYKYTFLFTFVVLIPILTIFTVKMLNFQFFPSFDGNYLYISGKANIDTPIEETQKIAEEIEKFVIEHKDEYALKATSTVAGSRVALSGESEQGDNLLYITMELYDMEPQNFIDALVNPILTFEFNFNDPERIRKYHTYEIAQMLKQEIEPLKEKYGLEELGVKEQKPGLIKSDIKINLSSKESQKIAEAITKIETKLETIPHVKDVTDNAQLGKKEYKLRINDYGEQLGLSESMVAKTLAGYFLDSRKAMTFGESGVMEIRTRALGKDSEDTLLNFMIPTPDGSFVKLTQIAEIEKIRAYEKIEKYNGNIVKSIFANVNKKETTPVEVLKEIEPLLDELRKQGIKVTLQGESEKNQQLKDDMKKAVLIALFLILIALLFIFPRIRYALMVMSVIPFSLLGALLGHLILDINLSMPSVIGMLGLAGVVINDGIIMLDFLHGTHNAETFYERAKLRLRPILITSITTFLGLFTLIFYATGQAVILQPIAISLGFGLLWGTVLNLVYLPALYAVVNKIKPTRE
ncbi:efflux RND transporter permease subunit [Sulfurovum sp. zt1-1]|uniref:Efflux RND transporter permease subunit n=1 Tax=Sulfurovum zhangzhouensis TaxID=3019067 RepID=A0ABT7R090_9BACT|nr:efflux RND transporter permease subunit [Sulfurovum zhangzhouensis]MDM5272509.1 efflux RND transporter permease subunit [Sulfurovum zhangzhouensis]